MLRKIFFYYIMGGEVLTFRAETFTCLSSFLTVLGEGFTVYCIEESERRFKGLSA